MVIPKKDRPPLQWDENNLIQRAYSAYFRQEKNVLGQLLQPNRNSSGVTEHDGKLYVVLTNGKILACYRLRNDGVLKGLKRIPDAVKKQFEY